MKEKIKSVLTKVKNNKKKVIGITVGVFLTFIFTFTVYNMNNPTSLNRLFASIGSVPNEAFEDSDFYNCIVDTYNNANGTSKAYTDSLTDEELASVTSLSCNSKNIESAKGVEKLTGLTSLNLSYNELKNIDLSKNILLTSLNLTENYFLGIDLSNNTELTHLNLYAGQLTSIDLSNNTAITELNINGNRLTNIDLSKNTVITELDLGGNQLTAIDLSNNLNLESLSLSENKLTNLDLSNNVNLSSLHIKDTPLAEDILMQNGETYAIEEKVIPPSGQSFSYSIDDTSVASIQGNTITALNEGNTTLKVNFGNISYERNLSVGKVYLSTNDDNIIINDDEKYIYCNGFNVDINYFGAEEYLRSNIGELVRENDKIKVILNDKVIAEYKLIYIEQAVNVTNDYLLLSLSVDNPNYINAVNCTYELLDNGNEIVVKYNGKEMEKKKVVYMYLPHKFKYFNGDLYISTKKFNESMINNINDISQIDKNKINVLNGEMKKELDGDHYYYEIKADDNRIGETLHWIASSSNNYDLSKDYIYLGVNEFDNDISAISEEGNQSTNELISYDFLSVNNNMVRLGPNDLIIDSWSLIKVSSDTYDMSGDVIDLKGTELDISKINVTNANLKVDNNKLLVMYNDEVVKEFSLENVKKEDTTTKPSEEKTTTTTRVTTKENKTTTTKKTTTTNKKKSIIDRIFGKSETTTKKEETTTKKTNILRRTNKTTKIISNNGNVANDNKNSNNKIVTKSNILILLLGIMDISLIVYIVINNKRIEK